MTLRKLAPAPNRGTQLIYVAGGYCQYSRALILLLSLSPESFARPYFHSFTLIIITFNRIPNTLQQEGLFNANTLVVLLPVMQLFWRDSAVTQI